MTWSVVKRARELLSGSRLTFILKTAWLFSPQDMYTDRATITGQRILVPMFADRWVSHDQRGGTQRGGTQRLLISVF
jgi:hypothetical protein